MAPESQSTKAGEQYMKWALNPTSPSFLTVISGSVLSTHPLRFYANDPVNWAVEESRVMKVPGGARAPVQQWTRRCWIGHVRLPRMATEMPFVGHQRCIL